MPKTPERAAPAIYRLFGSEVFEPIKADPRTKNNAGVYFGFSSSELSDLLQSGRVDFSTGYKFPGDRKITADELVLCYCHFMMKGHLFAARANFQYRHSWLADILKKAAGVVFIDVGCGPATGGLAFAECFPKTDFEYYGIDMAKAMQAKCRKMLEAAQGQGLVTSRTKIKCAANWCDIPTTFGTNWAIVLNFSFFFASKSLTVADIDSLVAFYNELVANNPDSRVVISYTNSTDTRAASNYKKFIEKLKIDYDAQPPLEDTVVYYTKIRDDATKPTTFCHEVFEIVD